MEPVTSSARGQQPGDVIKGDLRDLRVQLGMLNRHVGARLGLREVDLDCLDLVSRHGPLSPGALARQAGLHPATMTGILDRLERGGWLVRERDPADRRSVVLRVPPDRGREIAGLFTAANAAMDELFAGCTEDELQVIAGFLHRAVEAVRTAATGL
ncbi:MarR family transcriptional regulator [Catellatospora bangladeshensis]|uniref:MarR family transcriptional regulator n=1 Tax=Catellatospora bangladeshensis TaxID=310355 RepID=A0A8J3NIC8_9ACTN|nr:MarR family transcriptional regulator [Catellatospora bangladeshensis]GIF82315.1 MarR family transcriptional regulator [Catellatospora bangladeshensis]